MLSCPFLSHLPSGLIQSRPWSLLRFAQRCPVIGKHIQRAMTAGVEESTQSQRHQQPPPPPPMSEKKCPFLSGRLAASDAAVCGLSPPSECPYSRMAGRPLTVCCMDEQQAAPMPAEPLVPQAEPPNLYNYKARCEAQLQRKRDDHSYRVFRKVNRRGPSFPLAEEHTGGRKDITVWCSNDYLGMSWHPVVQEAVIEAARQHGVGSGGTRNISGNTIHHEALEAELADWHGKEAALLFTSCYVANEATLYTLGQLVPGLVFLSDAGNHASMIHGIRTSNCRKIIFPHNNVARLRQELLKLPLDSPKLVAFETVHSMTGDISPLAELCSLTRQFGGLSYVDEVHAVGMYGAAGAGVGERDGCLAGMDLISGTLGKAIGNIGGYVAGDATVIDAVRSYASGFIFTTSLPPTVLAGARASLAVLRSVEGAELRQRHQAAVQLLREALLSRGLPVIPAPSHIIPLHVGDPRVAQAISEHMMHRCGAYIQAINYPTVARGDERLRLAPTPHHTEPMIVRLADQLADAFRLIGPHLLRSDGLESAAADPPPSLQQLVVAA
uniref:5-aminolevulinate synthase n=2 Tax=Macrostomum lignano TaxID=282301 RepID=A0A1I8JJ18_9PLAT